MADDDMAITSGAPESVQTEGPDVSAEAPDTSGEFPTAWHREAYIEGLEREYEGSQVRGDEDQEKNALRELVRLGVKQGEKRPRRTAKNAETR